MNQLGANLPHKIFWLTVGAAFGGAAGYMISEVIVDRVLYGTDKPRPWDDEVEATDEPVEFKMDENSIENVAYNKAVSTEEKQALSELVRPYESESEEEIRIVSKDDVLVMPETVHYYTEDNTYSYENGDLIDDPNGLFVPNAHLHFGESDPDQADLLYVLNADMGLVYEIIKMNASYKEEILGEPPEEPKPKKKAVKKRSRRAVPPKKDPTADVTDEKHETDGK